VKIFVNREVLLTNEDVVNIKGLIVKTKKELFTILGREL